MADASRFHAEREAAVSIASEAGSLLQAMQSQARTINFKGQTDLVTDADRASEQLIATRLEELFPGDGMLGEESGYSAKAQSAERLWVVDPLDGTTNYAHQFPLYAVSIALIVNDVIEVGAVYVPTLDEMFSAERGEKATLNREPIVVSTNDNLRNALLGSGFSYNIEERERNFEHWRRFIVQARAVRRTGSAAYDLCCVACGRFDGYWERGPSAWDLAAGSLIVTEAGGMVSDFRLRTFDPFASEVLAASPGLHHQMSTILSD